MPLQKDTRAQLHEALLGAFLSYADLEMMLSFGLNQELNRISADVNNMGTVTFRLVKWAEATDQVDQLVIAARKVNPTNARLRAFAEEVDLAPQLPIQQYERVVMPEVGFQNPQGFRERMSAMELTVGRVEVPGPQGIGTAFLVGSNLALTNQHVREEWQGRGHQDLEIGIRFGYWKKRDGVEVEKGRAYALRENAIVHHSPVGELDYVLLRLVGTPGTDRVGDAPIASQRGFLKPVGHIWKPREPMLVLQHPAARPLELAIGSVQQAEEGSRVVHNANTEAGSSGSPCFTANWQLGAVHHWGSDSANRAVKFSEILKDLAAKNLMSQLV
jgi:hypothetical protein